MKQKLISLLFVIAIIFAGCNKNNDVVNPVTEAAKRVIVVNEGLFGQNNSSITSFDVKDKNVSQDVYASANNGSKLGDTANDMKIAGGKGYIVVNQSNKVEVIDIKNFQSSGAVDFTDYGGPRSICIVDNNAYVTTYGDNVVKFNTANLEVKKVIDVGAKPEGIVENSGYLFVANSGWGSGSSVSVIKVSSDSLVKNIEVGVNPRSVLSDSKYVYALCSDNYFAPTGRKGIYKIDAGTLTLKDSLILDSAPSDAAIGNGKMFLLDGPGVAVVDLSTFKITADSLISANKVNPMGFGIYSIAYDSESNLIYCGNPKDYTQNGEVAYFDLSGAEKGRFDTGINPGTIVIYKSE